MLWVKCRWAAVAESEYPRYNHRLCCSRLSALRCRAAFFVISGHRDLFDQLSEKLEGVLSGLRQRGVLTEPMIREGLREVRRVLLEADVNFQVAREFMEGVEEKGPGERVRESGSPGQQLVKGGHGEPAGMLGGKPPPLAPGPIPPTV